MPATTKPPLRIFRIRQTRTGRWVGEAYTPTSTRGSWTALSGGRDAAHAREEVLRDFVVRRRQHVRFDTETRIWTPADFNLPEKANS